MSRLRCRTCAQFAGLEEFPFDDLGLCFKCRAKLVDKLVDQLARPLYVYRMARANLGKLPNKSAQIRMSNAERQIVNLLAELMP